MTSSTPSMRLAAMAMATIAMLASGSGLAAAPSDTQPLASAAAPSIDVRAFVLRGNTLLSEPDALGVLAPWLGPRTLTQLRQAAQALQQRYAEAGWGGVVVYVPNQSFVDGQVTLDVLEGRLARVVIGGASRTSADQVRRALPSLQDGQTLHLRTLDREMLLANENPARQLRLSLKPGGAPGETAAEVLLQEAAVHLWTLGLDTSGSRQNGRWRATLGWQHADISGHDDQLALQYQTAPGHWRQVDVRSVSYRRPVYPLHVMLDAYAATSDVDGGTASTDAGDVSFNGNGRVFGARAAMYLPRLGDADQRLALSLDRRTYVNRCTVAGLPAGACGSASGEVTVTPLALDYRLSAQAAAQPYATHSMSASLTLQANLRLGAGHGAAADFAGARSEATPAFWQLRPALGAAGAFARDWLWRTQFQAQYTTKALIPGEQFGLGGAGSLRGYEERELAGDTGHALTAEFLTPPWDFSMVGQAGQCRGLVFVDEGRLRNRAGTPLRTGTSSHSLSSWGGGLRGQWGQTQASVDVAQALDSAADTHRGDWRAHLSVTTRF